MLQRELGELGEVLPRIARGGGKFRAAGWYARLADGTTLFLGDHSIIAVQTIGELVNTAEQGAPA